MKLYELLERLLDIIGPRWREVQEVKNDSIDLILRVIAFVLTVEVRPFFQSRHASSGNLLMEAIKLTLLPEDKAKAFIDALRAANCLSLMDRSEQVFTVVIDNEAAERIRKFRDEHLIPARNASF